MLSWSSNPAMLPCFTGNTGKGFNWSDPFDHGHPKSIKYAMLSSGNEM